jgi:streptogramin lyase
MQKYRSPNQIMLYFALVLSLVACGGNAGASTTAKATATPDTTNNQPGTGSKGLPLYCPISVTIDRQDNLFVSDNDNATIHERIIKLSPAGQELGEWHIFPPGRLGTAQGPGNAAFDVQGNLYVINLDNFKIVKVSPDGKILTSWGSPGNGQGQFQIPQGIAVDSQGNVYVGDSNGTSGRIEKFSNTGKFLSIVTTLANSFPLSLVVDSNDNLYIANDISLIKISPAGQIIGKLQIVDNSSESSSEYWTTLSIDAHGDLYATKVTVPRFGQGSYPNILKIDYTAGKVLTGWSVWKSGIKAVESTILDSQGNLYAIEMTNTGAMQLQKFSSTGEVLATWKGTCISS